MKPQKTIGVVEADAEADFKLSLRREVLYPVNLTMAKVGTHIEITIKLHFKIDMQRLLHEGKQLL